MDEFESVQSIKPQFYDGRAAVVLLDKVDPDVKPSYHTCGKVTCITCDEWLWLGPKTLQAVQTGKILGICGDCLRKALPEGAEPIATITDC